MKTLELIKRSLGFEFLMLKSGIMIHQQLYSRQILSEAQLEDCGHASTPLPEKFIFGA